MKISTIRLTLAGVLLLAALLYWPGLRGGFEFDDFPNIVDAGALHIDSLSPGALGAAAWASPASDFQRPLASLSFALNHYFTGLDPRPMKLTNLVIHLLNGLLLFALLHRLLSIDRRGNAVPEVRAELVALLVTGLWLVHPINLTGVLYVVQRMESLAQLFVLLGLIVYLDARVRLAQDRPGSAWRLWLVVPACLVAGATAKESAVLLPVLTLIMEFTVLAGMKGARQARYFHFAFLLIPALVGLAWLVPRTLDSSAWAFRDFSLGERLLTQPGVLLSYLAWILLPLPQFFGFYRDGWPVSSGLLTPWSTLPALVALAALVALVVVLRRRTPLVALGLGWFLGAHLLTSSFLPLELVFEHRNYLASAGVLLALVAILRPPAGRRRQVAIIGYGVLGTIAVLAMATLWLRVMEWSDPLRLAVAEAARNPESPRATYNLGRTLVILGDYDPDSPLTWQAAEVLDRAMRLEGSGLLPPVARLMLADRSGQPVPEEAWVAIDRRLASRALTPEDSTALRTLVDCQVEGRCDLPDPALLEVLMAAAHKEPPDAMVLYAFARFAYNRMGDEALALTLARDSAGVGEPQYQLNLVNFLIDVKRLEEAGSVLEDLRVRLRPGQLAVQLEAATVRLDCLARSNGNAGVPDPCEDRM